jgi:hypothetical protein
MGGNLSGARKLIKSNNTYEVTFSATTATQAIPSVNLSKSIIHVLSITNSTGESEAVRVKFNSSTQVGLSKTSTNSITVVFRVIEFYNPKQLISADITVSANSSEVETNAVNLDNSFIFYSHSFTGAIFPFGLKVVDNTQTSIVFANNRSFATTVTYFIVEFF